MKRCRATVAIRLFAALALLGLLAAPGAAATVTTFAGTGVKGFAGDGGPARQAQLNNVYAVARGPDGFLYLADMDNARVRRVGPDGTIETYAGSSRKGYAGDGGAADKAALDQPYELAWDKRGNLFIVELGNHCVRRVDAKSRVISTIAGTGKRGFSGDGGPATAAQFNQPHSLAFDAAGNLYVCDIANHRVRKIDMATGTISTWCGTGEGKTAPDGSPIGSAALFGPRALAFGKDGKCYLALREGNALVLLDSAAGTLRRVAGSGKQGFSGNGGPALAAALAGPKCVSLDARGNVYLADTESHSIRYYDPAKGTIEPLVGNGKRGDGPDGNPADCQLARPHGVFVDQDGSIFIGDSENHRVRLWRE